MLNDIINEKNVEDCLIEIINYIHIKGPINPVHMEQLTYIKNFNPVIFSRYEKKLLYTLGLFYKVNEPESIIEKVYEIFSETIRYESNRNFTPVQAHAYKQILEKKYFSFSAPTSAGKSFLFRELIQNTNDDIVIVVPSRALISEYLNILYTLVDNTVLVLSFIENINIINIKRRIFVITPERGVELFKNIYKFNIKLFLLDEAQISEEDIRGLKFDSFVRRIDSFLPDAKKVFAHPFIENPDAQLKKHGFNTDNSFYKYEQLTVGKQYISFKKNKFKYFSPFEDFSKSINRNIIKEVLLNRGTLLIYISKNKIYENQHIIDFDEYINLCPKITDLNALKLINELESFIGSSSTNPEKFSLLIDMMKQGVVIHHGSIPLKARLIIEKFVNSNYASICFATATLIQGINMPFDVVWIDNFLNMTPLNLKNLIGRAGRTSSKLNTFESGYVIIKESNLKTFSGRLKESVRISEISKIDEDYSSIGEDYRDIVDAIINDSFNDDLYLTNSQIERLKDHSIIKDIKFILDNFLIVGIPITGSDYYHLEDKVRKKIKDSFRKIYTQHLRKDKLSRAESSVLSTAIPIMLWHIQGKSFSEMVSLRHAFITEKDKRRKIISLLRRKEISSKKAKEMLNEIPVRYSPTASSLPNSKLSDSSLFTRGTLAVDVNYDTLVYDTYDYLDKVISLSIIDPLCAAFQIYFDETTDNRALIMKNFIRYGTNNNIEIWLMRYGLSFEEIELLYEYIDTVDENQIVFKKSITDVNIKNYDLIKRYINFS